MTRITLYYYLALWLAFCSLGLSAETSQGNCYSDGQLAGAIVGSILCTLLAAGLIFLAVFLIRRKRRRALANSPKEEIQSKSDITAFAYDNPYFKDDDAESSLHDVEKGVSSETSPAHISSEGSDSTKSNKTLPGVTKAKKTKWTKPSNPFGSLLSNKKRAMDDSNLVLEPEVITVPLKGHDFTGLGFNICGNMRDGVFVRDVLHRGPAIESGCIKQGDRILSVTVSFTNIVYEDALTILSYASPYDVKLELQKEEVLTNLQKKPSLSNLVHSNSERLYHPLYRSQSIDDLSQIGKDPTKYNAKRALSSGIAIPYISKWEKEKKAGHSEETIAEVLEVPNREDKETNERKYSLSSEESNKPKQFIELNSGQVETKSVTEQPSVEVSPLTKNKFIVIGEDSITNKNPDQVRERIPSVAEAKAEIEELHVTGIIAAPLTDSSSESDDQKNPIKNKPSDLPIINNPEQKLNKENVQNTIEKLKEFKVDSSDSEGEKIKPKYLKKQDKDGKNTLSRIKRKKDLDASEDLTRMDQNSPNVRDGLANSSSSDEELNRLDGIRYRRKRKNKKQRSSSLGDLTTLKMMVNSLEPLRTKSMEFGEIDSKTALFISPDPSPHRRYKKKRPSRPNSRNQIRGSRELSHDSPCGTNATPLTDSSSGKSTPEASPGLSKFKPYENSWSTLERSRSWQSLDRIGNKDDENSETEVPGSEVAEYSTHKLDKAIIHNDWVDEEHDKLKYMHPSILPASKLEHIKINNHDEQWTEDPVNDVIDHADIYIETEEIEDVPPPPPLMPPPDTPNQSHLSDSDEDLQQLSKNPFPFKLDTFHDKPSLVPSKIDPSNPLNINNMEMDKHVSIIQIQSHPAVSSKKLDPPPILPKPSTEASLKQKTETSKLSMESQKPFTGSYKPSTDSFKNSTEYFKPSPEASKPSVETFKLSKEVFQKPYREVLDASSSIPKEASHKHSEASGTFTVSDALFSPEKEESLGSEPRLKRKFSFKKGKEVFEISDNELNSVMISHQDFLNLQAKVHSGEARNTSNVLSFVPANVEKTKEGGMEFETWSFVEKKTEEEPANTIRIDFNKLKQERKTIESIGSEWDIEHSPKINSYNPFVGLADETLTIDLDEESELEPLIESGRADSEEDHDSQVINPSTIITIQNTNSTNPFLNELNKAAAENNVNSEQKFSNTVYVRLTPSPTPGQKTEKREVTALKLGNQIEEGTRHHNGHNYENVMVGTNHVPVLLENQHEVPSLSPDLSPGPLLIDPQQYQQFLYFQQLQRQHQLTLLNMQLQDNSPIKPLHLQMPSSYDMTTQQQLPPTSSQPKTPPPKLETPDEM